MEESAVDASFVGSRRRFLVQAAAVTGSMLALPYAPRAPAQAARLRSVRLSENMLAVVGPGANCLAARSGDGIIMVDGGHASWSEALLALVRDAFSGRPVSALFNTHWHEDQTGSNVAAGMQGAEIIAHENTKLWLGTEVWVRWSDKVYPPLPSAGLPTTTVYESGGMRLADRRVEYGYMLNAHTDGDIWVFFPEENVLVTGGHVSNDGWPVIDWWTGGWIGGMLDGFDALLAVADEHTHILPTKGPIMSRAELESQRVMYLTIFDRIQEMLRKSYGTDEVLAAGPTAEFDEQWGDPELFVTLAFQSLWGHLRDAHDKRLKNIA